MPARSMCALALLPLQPARESRRARHARSRLTQNPLITVDTSPSLGDNVNGPSIIRVPVVDPASARPLLRLLRPSQGTVHPARVRRRDHRPVEDLRAGRRAGQRDGVLSSAAGSARRPGRSVLHPRRVAGDLRRRRAQAARDVDARVVDRRSALAARRCRGARLGAAERLRSVHPVERVGRRPALRAAARDHQGQLPSRLPVRRLPVRHGAPRSAAAVEGSARDVRDRSESVCRRSVRRSRPPRRDAAARPDACTCSSPGSATRPSASCCRRSISPATGRRWKASAPVELLRPEAPYECPDLPNVPSAAGEIEGPARQLRDPAIFEEAGKTYLFYSICGEQGLAAAELTFRYEPFPIHFANHSRLRRICSRCCIGSRSTWPPRG